MTSPHHLEQRVDDLEAESESGGEGSDTLAEAIKKVKEEQGEL